MTDEIIELFKQLKLHGMAAGFPGLLAKAEREGWGHQNMLRHLLAEELQHQRQRSVRYRLKQAKIPWDWPLSTFPFERQPAVDRTRIMTLAGLDFM